MTYRLDASLLCFVLLFGLLGTGVHAESPWTPDDLVRVETARGFALSADGKQVAWVQSRVAEVEEEERRVSNIWAAKLPRGEAMPWTRGVERAFSPKFSPDGKLLAFLSDRKFPADRKAPDKGAKTQLWVLHTSGGEAFPVTRLPRSVSDFDWIDGKNLVVAAPEGPSAHEKALREQKDTSEVVEDLETTPPIRLFRVNLDGKVKRLTQNDDWIDLLSVSPDGRRAVVRAQQSLSYGFDGLTAPQTRWVDLETGESTPLLEDGQLLPDSVSWSLDSSGFYLVNSRSRHPLYRTATISEIHHHDLSSGQTKAVDLDSDRGLGRSLGVTQDGLVALLHGGVRYRPVRVGPEGVQDLVGQHVKHLDALVLSRDGATLVYQTSSATQPPQWFVSRLEGNQIVDEKVLTRLNSGYDGKATGKVEVLRWTGARGDTVEGLLHYPLDWADDGQPRPLVLDIHGGPAGVDRDTWDQRWASPVILYRQRGAFVLQVNYHGSSGYGLDWVESLEGHYYELEIPDIENGVDHLIERGLVDPDRLGSTGWSNGGILTAELITRTDRYKAASVGAADVEWISDWANVDFGATFDNYYFGGPPWEIPEVYIEKSPFFRLDQVTTPTIVHTGTEDRNVPPHQSWSLFRALQQLGKTETRLVLYPGEPHSLRKVAHQRRKIEEDMAWFDRYLFATHVPPTPQVPKDSALHTLLQRASAKTHDGRLGEVHRGSLIPEMAPYQGLLVGRFEVTRAQWAAFESGYDLASGDGDLPVTGISFDRAQAYVTWLSETTGRHFRLPTAAEAQKMAKAAGTGGNTLDHWVGYSPNPEDKAKILAALEERGGTSLLLPVGRNTMAGKSGHFDLDGNAAEWATDGAQGAAVGASADRGTKDTSSEASAAYVGLRVVESPGQN